jgi:hypothetical protein
MAGKGYGNIVSVDDLAKLSRDDIIQSIDFRVPEDSDGFINAKVPNSQCLLEIIHAEPVGMTGGDGGYDVDAVTVSVRLHDRHHGSTRSYYRTESIKVSSNSGSIDFNPGQHRNILF